MPIVWLDVGFDLLLVARDATRLNNAATDVGKRYGRNVETHLADLTARHEIRSLEERLQHDQLITALIKNAGFGGEAGLLNSNIDELENMIELNVTALTRLTLLSCPAWQSAGRARLSTSLPSSA